MNHVYYLRHTLLITYDTYGTTLLIIYYLWHYRSYLLDLLLHLEPVEELVLEPVLHLLRVLRRLPQLLVAASPTTITHHHREREASALSD